MEILFANPYNMVFAGTVMVGVLMLTVSLLAFLVLAVVASITHGLVTLSRKVVTSVFSRACLIFKQSPAASVSADATAASATGTASQMIPVNAMASQGQAVWAK